MPRTDGLAKVVGQVCSGQEATLMASGHYVDELYRWRRLNLGGGQTGWLVDGPSSGSGSQAVTLVSRGSGPADGPYIEFGTPVEVYPPVPQCLPVRSFPSTYPQYGEVIGQVCDVTSATVAADMRFRDEGLFWRRLEIDGASGRIVGWVTDGTFTGSQPRSVYNPATEQRPTPTPTPPATPTPLPTVRPPTATPTEPTELPLVKQLSVRSLGYIDMDGRYGIEFQYELNRLSDGYWILIVDSFDYCRDATGAKLGMSSGFGSVASQFSPHDRGLVLSGNGGVLYGEFGASFLVPNPSDPPPLPISCTHIGVSVAHIPKAIWDVPSIHLTPVMADQLYRFELEAATSKWGFWPNGTLGQIHWRECPTCTGSW
ncbi:MAG: hypothetical protein AB7J35_06000 [Dehalococcoidia bacterium]